MKKILVLLLIVVSISVSAQIQKNNKSVLTIEQIMQDPAKWIGTSPDNISWSEQSDRIFFDWNPEKDTISSEYAFNLKQEKTEKLSVAEKKHLPAKSGSYNAARTMKTFTRNGNLFLFDIEKGTEKQLTAWLGGVSSPKFVMGDTQISFMRDNNLFCINPETGLIRQITNFIAGDERPEQKAKGQELFLENQQTELFDVLKQRQAVDKPR